MNNYIETLIELAMYPGDWVVATLANTGTGNYLGFFESDVGGTFSVAISIILTPLIIFLLIYPFKNLVI